MINDNLYQTYCDYDNLLLFPNNCCKRLVPMGFADLKLQAAIIADFGTPNVHPIQLDKFNGVAQGAPATITYCDVFVDDYGFGSCLCNQSFGVRSVSQACALRL